MPYNGPNDSSLPKHVKDLSEKLRKQWVEVFNSAYEKCQSKGGSDCEGAAFRQANGTVKSGESGNDAITPPVDGSLDPMKNKEQIFSENLDKLKTALDAVNSAIQAYADADDGESDEYSSINRQLKWVVSDLKSVMRQKWLDSQVFGQSSENLKSKLSELDNTSLREPVGQLSEAIDSIANSIDSVDPTHVAQWQATFSISVLEAERLSQTIAQRDTGNTGDTGGTDDNHTDASAAASAGPEPTTEGVSFHHIDDTVVFAEGSEPNSNKYRMLVIKSGLSKNKVQYSESVLKESSTLLNGRPLYIDHPEGIETGQPKGRSLATKVGWWSDAQYQEGISLPDGSTANGVLATANLMSAENSPAPWFPGYVKEALDRGRPDLVGISIMAQGSFRLRRDSSNGIYKEALALTSFVSADAVAEPGAGGQAYLAASKGVDPDVKTWEQVTAEDVKGMSFESCIEGLTVRPDLMEEFKARIAQINESAGASGEAKDYKNGDDDDDEEKKKKKEKDKKSESATNGSAAESNNSDPANNYANDVIHRMEIRESRQNLREKLEESGLTTAVQKQVREEANVFLDNNEVISESHIDQMINRAKQIYSSAVSEVEAPGNGRSSMLSAGTVIPPNGRTGANVEMLSEVEQASLALDEFFGAPISEEYKGRYPRIHSFSEFYRGITGDNEINGRYDKDRGVLGEVWESTTFAEALPNASNIVGGGTITMQNLLGTSMNRALFNFYQAQPKWWEPIVTKANLANMKQQDRVRLHNFGSLTERTVDGEEYTELQWGETAESYTPTEYGNLVTVGRRAIINDDLRGIQSIPRLLGQSATVTLNEYMSSLFTINSGNGPTLSDSVQVFNSGSHQGNRLTLPLNRQNLISARKTIMKMNNDAGKRIGLEAKTLLVPIDLEDTAFELLNSAQVPGSANNEPNLLSDGTRGLNQMITVPNWTDETNWYVMADPSQLSSIELGFLFGREDPEFFEQNTPSVGMVFTNDVMSWKIRHDFGADWVDYRGAVGSIVS